MGKYYGYVPHGYRTRSRVRQFSSSPVRRRWPHGWGPNVRSVHSSDSRSTATRLFRAQEQQHAWRVAYANNRGFYW